ncbi:MAG: 16S rRNA (guanine(966)-N(2))-methyltransferase RsmD [Veillonellales bacterium]
MRIITGSAKGTKLKTPRGLDTRPTADRVKESIFNILSEKIMDAVVLDLFSGTGNLALEALSRGASRAVLVDQSLTSIAVIKQNVLQTKCKARVEILKCEALKALQKMIQIGWKFDLIFCDPPYNKGLNDLVLQTLDRSQLLAPRGVIVIEHSQHELLVPGWNKLEIRRVEKYGETAVSFLQYNN